MLNRQRILLYLLGQAGNTAPKIALMKWCFLLSQETPTGQEDPFYKFLPYHYGPYSFSLEQEATALMRDGLLIPSGKSDWSLTSVGQKVVQTLPVKMKQDCNTIMQRYGKIATPRLIAQVYAHYPWFTINSKQEQKRSQTRPVAACAVYTVGYEKKQIDGFLNLLLETGIQRLIDVRANPVSRRYGFHKSTLDRLCSLLQIEYQHFPELGISGALRANLTSSQDYQQLFRQYETDILPKQQAAVVRVATAVVEKASVLVCQEADPTCCHRLRLAKQVAKMANLPIVNIGWANA